VRGDHVFAERLRVATDNTMSSDNKFPYDDFFSNIDNLFSNPNMGDNTDVVADTTANASAAQVAPYVFLPFILQSLLEFLVRVYVVDAIEYLDVIC
jgi:hypothetical protein